MTSRNERLAWYALITASLLLRLFGLGDRAMSHDESLHALYSWYLSTNGEYHHDPMMHGPLLFHLNALVYLICGDTDFSARLIPALLGTGCVAMLALYRDWLGRGGAFAAAVLVSLEPGLLYHSRYIRNDIYICLFTLLIAWSILRYIGTARIRYLFWLGLGMALNFTCKEVSFIHGFVFGAFACGMAIHNYRHDLWKILDSRWLHIGLFILTLALPFAVPLLQHLIGWDPMDSTSPLGQSRTLGLFVAFCAASAAIAVAVLGPHLHDRAGKPGLTTWGKVFGMFWLIQATFYTTFFTNAARGFCSGVSGSLGYWLAQHGVERGAEDNLFYLSLLFIYEPLLLYLAVRSFRRIRAIRFRAFLVCWVVANFVIYSWAGERMPWLLTHISLPLCIMSGPALAHLLQQGRVNLSSLILLILFGHFLINSARLNGPLAESARELLVYAHAGPDVKPAVRRITEHMDEDPGAFVAIHHDYSWPLAWYMRGRHDMTYFNTTEEIPEDTTLIVADVQVLSDLSDDPNWIPEGPTTMVHWPIQSWHAISGDNLSAFFTSSDTRRRFYGMYLHREYEGRTEANWDFRAGFNILTRAPIEP